MAYMRGNPYIWSDSEYVHIWSANGAENISQMEGFSDCPAAAGLCLPHEQLDSLALMLFAELVRSGQLASSIERTLQTHSQNFGVAALRELGARIVEVCKPLTAAT